MPSPLVGVRVGDDVIEAVRRKLGLPEGTPAPQTIRAGLLRLLGHADATGEPVDRGGRRHGFSPKRQSVEAGK